MSILKKIVAVTVNYNRDDVTKKLLESLDNAEKKGFSLQVIVVDNSENKKFFINDKHNIEIHILRPSGNTGFSGGNNVGIKEALQMDADYILLINDDTTISSEMLIELFEAMEHNPEVGVASPMIYFAKGHEFHKDRYKKEQLGNVIWFAGGRIDWKNAKSIHNGVDEVDQGQFDTVKKIDFATGCCMMVRREVFEKVKLFNEKYFLYYEDADLCQRIKKSGFEISFIPSAKMYHENASSSGGAGNQLHDYFLTRNQMIFGMKYAPFMTKAALVRQSIRLLFSGRKYQKKGIIDYYKRRFGKGTYFEK